MLTIKDIEWKVISPEEAEELGINEWETLTDEEPLEEPWTVEEQEAGYIMEGEAIVKVGSEEMRLTPGMLVSFPKGLECIWITPKYMKKAYKESFTF